MPAASIQEIPTTDPLVHAFRITGTVTDDDMSAMAQHMNAAFDASGPEKVSMLLIFEGYEGADAGAAFDASALKAQFRSLTQVVRYAVVGAPDAARSMIETMDHVIPIDARTFDAQDEAQAWAFVGADPAP